ncbi:MAG: hypothetical protein E6R05_06195 [Candidatus Moraniibacteriota bacterium]|jgi:hypothetical protein|nr:MAG: hypothetical protein E6R05_06195 [Candidatus Moranbacteria bacterium]
MTKSPHVLGVSRRDPEDFAFVLNYGYLENRTCLTKYFFDSRSGIQWRQEKEYFLVELLE